MTGRSEYVNPPDVLGYLAVLYQRGLPGSLRRIWHEPPTVHELAGIPDETRGAIASGDATFLRRRTDAGAERALSSRRNNRSAQFG